MGMSAYLKDRLLGHTLLGSEYVYPNVVYLSLATSVNDLGTTFEEISAASYSRKQMIFGSPNSYAVSNASTVSFGTALETWGTVKHIGIWDAASGGNLLYLYTLNGVGRKILPNMRMYVNPESLAVDF